ncbi:MAG: M23 family metallopeptidase [Tyzzerella sp.]|nr:M23 family metallopeptidase [Tyzzerella sp.]
MSKQACYLSVWIIIIAFFVSLWSGRLMKQGQIQRLSEGVISTAEFREQNIGEEMLDFLKELSEPGKYVGIYLLESKFGYQEITNELSEEGFLKMSKRWEKKKNFHTYLKVMQAIWDDVKYFPIAKSTNDPKLTVSYTNSWMGERNYGGKRGHEGCDLMANKNQRGLYPVLSMTDGIVEKKGWLEKGGYRIGIKAPGGAYFYYAHLDSYAELEVGDEVKAGDILGFMGDSGYGPEGTVGQFAVHLHLGIYIYPHDIETSVNPYWVLRYIEKSKVKCYTEE